MDNPLLTRPLEQLTFEQMETILKMAVQFLNEKQKDELYAASFLYLKRSDRLTPKDKPCSKCGLPGIGKMRKGYSFTIDEKGSFVFPLASEPALAGLPHGKYSVFVFEADPTGSGK